MSKLEQMDKISGNGYRKSLAKIKLYHLLCCSWETDLPIYSNNIGVYS